jgi:uncharacterized protein (DUF1499 family)
MSGMTLLIVAVSLPIGGIIVLSLLSAASRWRPRLGMRDGQLHSCSSFPKGVSTTADDHHRIEPLRFDDSPTEAWTRLQRVMRDWPRTRVLSVSDGYMHVECASLLFRFLDDVEFLLDGESQVIHFRASARVGMGDLGVNRRRMEHIRRVFSQGRPEDPLR